MRSGLITGMARMYEPCWEEAKRRNKELLEHNIPSQVVAHLMIKTTVDVTNVNVGIQYTVGMHSKISTYHS